MATFVCGMNQSLDGYVDHTEFAPDGVLFRHFVEQVREQAGAVYGREMYEVMRYWDDDDPGWTEDERAFATAWRNTPKWVVSSTLTSVGDNAFLVEGDLEQAMRTLKAERDGEIEVLSHFVKRIEIAMGEQPVAFHAAHENTAGAVLLAEFQLGADLAGIDQRQQRRHRDPAQPIF